MTTDLCPVMLFSGKGGVGKTTLAAATAVRLASLGSRVLVMSTDPAHSLSDVFDLQLGPHPLRIMAGLDAMEVDAKGMFSEAIHQSSVGEASKLGELMSMMSETPGVDEFGAIEVLLQAIENAQHDVVIIDTAPTGHTLRLLMLPELMDGWLGKLLEMKARIARAGKFLRRFLPGGRPIDADDLEHGLSGGRQRISNLRELLMDPERAQIILVSIPEAMSVLETQRTLELLSGHGLPVAAVVVNQLQPEGEACPHCSRRREIHVRELEHMRRVAGGVPVRIVESFPWEIRGLASLLELGRVLWGEGAGSGAA